MYIKQKEYILACFINKIAFAEVIKRWFWKKELHTGLLVGGKSMNE